MIPRFPFYGQLGELDCGATCLKMITDFYQNSVSYDVLHQLLPTKKAGVSLKDISDSATQLGLRTMGVKVSFDRLAEDIPTPCIAHWKNQHFVVVYHVNQDYVWIADPSTKGIYLQSRESFQDGWLCGGDQDAGVLLLFETTPRFFNSKPKRKSKKSKKLELTN